jgi:LmbE family N-acetylglucosaminyl deacetylase
MMKEEKELRKYIREHEMMLGHKEPTRLLKSLVAAIRAEERERAAKVADAAALHYANFAEHAKKKGHDVDDIVARRISSEDIAAAIRAKK